MPLTTYTSGEVLTAASLNANFSFAAQGGLVRVGGGSLSGGATTFSSVFSSTYDAYKIVLSNGAFSANSYTNMTLGSTSTGYISYVPSVVSTTGNYSNAFGGIPTSSWSVAFTKTLDYGATWDIVNPNLAKRTHIYGGMLIETSLGAAGTMFGTLNNTTQYTAFTLTQSVGNLTGTVNIYGYTLS
jgi:hypothetical protein